MNIDPDAPVITVMIQISGPKGTYLLKAALDTGSTLTIIPWKIAEQLGYHPALSTERIPIATASGTENIPLITVERMEALGKVKERAIIGCHDLPPQTTVNGLLGLDFLRGFVTTLDLKRGELIVE